jgi:hypothetical protein
MSRLDQGLERAAAGDTQGRNEALRNMVGLRSLIEKAGGLNRLRARWADDRLSEMNTHRCNAYEVYNVEIFALAHPLKRLRGNVSRHNVGLARRQADQARIWYRSLK